MISRVLLVCLSLAWLGLLGCDAPASDPFAEHVLNRTGYGAGEWSLQRIRALGVNGYLDEQLHPERLDDAQLEADLRRRYRSLSMSLPELREAYDQNANEVRRELTRAKVLRAVHSRRQLEQVLVDFWFNHFNVDARREVALWAVVPYERDAIRPYVLGRFEDMLRAVARHPAMLEYLDNAQNFRDGYVRGRDAYGVNENFARELLELHTVGAGAGQTLADIHATALAFTGWTVHETLQGEQGFVYLDDGHDRSEKRILGLTLPAGGGIADGDRLIRYLAQHPDAAVQIAQKLCRRFVAERPTGCEVAAAARFLASGGDLGEVMREILRSEAFRDPRYFRSKVKRPLHAIASVARATGVADDDEFARLASEEVRAMGEHLYGAAPPTGWPDLSQTWLGEGPFIRRLNLAYLAASGAWELRAPPPLSSSDPEDVATGIVDRFLLGGAEPATRAELVRLLRAVDPRVWLREGGAFVMSSADFVHH